MASSLRLVASNLVTRSFRPTTAVSGSRFPCIDAGHRSYSTTPKDDCNDQSVLTITSPNISSMSFKMTMTDTERHLEIDIPDADLRVELDMPGLKMKDMRAGAEQNNMLFQSIKQSPDKTSSNIKEDGMLKVTLPNEDELKNTNIILNNLANDIISSFRAITANRSWSYYDMFSDRSVLGNGLCRLIAMRSPINSFTIRKRVIAGLLEIEMSIPGEQEMKLATQGLRVSSRLGRSMHSHVDRQMERDEVTAFFDYDTFFIEGRTMRNHHITCIHLPEGIDMKHNMINNDMIGDVFYALLPYCGKMDELHQLKLIS